LPVRKTAHHSSWEPANIVTNGYEDFSTDGEYPIIVFDPDGKFVRAFGEDWKPDRDGNGTHGMQILQEGR